ncbi:MAG TPA: hypothetical protein VNG31_05055, partial [Candidatus Baltobacteraceae bacterium]|nr:hypothetical protein [Candidatus Baltobacteraceae bacterium]
MPPQPHAIAALHAVHRETTSLEGKIIAVAGSQLMLATKARGRVGVAIGSHTFVRGAPRSG